MTISELKNKVITAALEKHNGNVELAALEIGLTSRTIYTFKAEKKKIGFFRTPPTMNEQLESLFKHKYIYCVEENFIHYCESNNIEVDYNYPDVIINKMIPISICGIEGNEFKKFTDIQAIEISSNMIKLINGEEQEILMGVLKGEGSEILYS